MVGNQSRNREARLPIVPVPQMVCPSHSLWRRERRGTDFGRKRRSAAALVPTIHTLRPSAQLRTPCPHMGKPAEPRMNPGSKVIQYTQQPKQYRAIDGFSGKYDDPLLVRWLIFYPAVDTKCVVRPFFL
jgi:hypothetical protein